MRTALSCGLAFVAIALGAVAAHAHTLASTVVSVTMTHQGIVNITIAAEADPLIVKLEALAGAAASAPPATTAERRARLESLSPTLRSHIDARIAGSPLTLDLQDVAVDDTAQTEIHLTARVPPGSPSFTWRSTFIFGAYQLAITSGDAAESIEWLQGPHASTPISLKPARAKTEPVVAGETYTRIGPALAMGALVVYVISRRRAGHRLAGG